MGLNLDNEVSGYFLERLQAKRDIHDEISSEYPNDIGTIFSEYGEKLNVLYGNDILGLNAADALHSAEGSYVVASIGYEYKAGYNTRLNKRNAGKNIVLSGITVLSIDCPNKFKFWFSGNDVSTITFPDLSVLSITDENEILSNSTATGWTNSRTLFNNVKKINMPNLKYVSENLYTKFFMPDAPYRLGVTISNDIEQIPNDFDIEMYKLNGE